MRRERIERDDPVSIRLRLQRHKLTKGPLYKIVDSQDRACSGGTFQYQPPKEAGKPGPWSAAVPEVVMCGHGFHVVPANHIRTWARATRRIYRIGHSGTIQWDHKNRKAAVERIRLVEFIGQLPDDYNNCLPYTSRDRTGAQILAIARKGEDEMRRQDDADYQVWRQRKAAAKKRRWKRVLEQRKKYPAKMAEYRAKVRAHNKVMRLHDAFFARFNVKREGRLGIISVLQGWLHAKGLPASPRDAQRIISLRKKVPVRPVYPR